jgi:hypothetical protein
MQIYATNEDEQENAFMSHRKKEKLWIYWFEKKELSCLFITFFYCPPDDCFYRRKKWQRMQKSANMSAGSSFRIQTTCSCQPKYKNCCLCTEKMDQTETWKVRADVFALLVVSHRMLWICIGLTA